MGNKTKMINAQKKQYIKLMPRHSIITESRNRRELKVVNDYGYKITIISADTEMISKYGFTYKLINDGFRAISYDMTKLKRILIFAFDSLKMSMKLRKMSGDVVSCHDLGALIIAWFSNLFKKNKKKLIYDSHEFELGRSVQRGKIILAFIKIMEKMIIKKCAFSIMVSDSIADEVKKTYKLRIRPIVIRSVPDYWILIEDEIKKIRKMFCNKLNVSLDSFIIMYHGNITPARNIGSIIDAIQRNEDVYAVILGNAMDESYKVELKERVNMLDISDKIYFHDAVDSENLYKYVGAVDLGIILFLNEYKSIFFSLPNKFFENIQSLTPMITSNFPEMARLINKYKIGIAVNPQNNDMIDKSIKKMKDDKVFYQKCKNNLNIAKKELCWENEKQILIDAFDKYL